MSSRSAQRALVALWLLACHPPRGAAELGRHKNFPLPLFCKSDSGVTAPRRSPDAAARHAHARLQQLLVHRQMAHRAVGKERCASRASTLGCEALSPLASLNALSLVQSV